MVLAMFKRKGAKAQSLRNQAVQAVGESYFLVAMFGLVVSGVLGILTVAMGEYEKGKKERRTVRVKVK